MGMNFVDMAGAELLAREGDRRRAIGGSLSLVGVNMRVHRLLNIRAP
jgi:hypothetical protein